MTDFFRRVPTCLVLLIAAITLHPVWAQTTTINAGPTSVSADGAQYAIVSLALSGTSVRNAQHAFVYGNSLERMLATQSWRPSTATRTLLSSVPIFGSALYSFCCRVSATISPGVAAPTATFSGDGVRYAISVSSMYCSGFDKSRRRVVQYAGELKVTGVSPTIFLGGTSASVEATDGIVFITQGTASLNMNGGTVYAVRACLHTRLATRLTSSDPRYIIQTMTGASTSATYISGTGYEATVGLAGGPVTIEGSGARISKSHAIQLWSQACD